MAATAHPPVAPVEPAGGLVRLLEVDPELGAALEPDRRDEARRRTAARAFRLSVQMAICQLPRVELRLMLALWHLAERFGRVGPEGVTLPLPLSHRLLGQVVGARRPTVTLALTRLHQAGLVERLDGVWRLHGHAPGELGELRTLAQARRRPAGRPR